MAYWWGDDPTQRYWVEIRGEPGTGTSLWCSTLDAVGSKDPWYELVASVQQDEVIYHWHAREHRFVGRSFAASDAVENRDDGRYEVALRDFSVIAVDISLEQIREKAERLYGIRDGLLEEHGSPLYLPFQFTQDRGRLSFMSNYFAKFPAEMITLLFGEDEMGETQLRALPASPEPTGEAGVAVGSDPRGFLVPFKPKTDAEYLVNIEGGRRTRTRTHERLVNSCAEWLSALDLSPARNAAVDLGLEDPPVVIEAKTTGTSWANSIRAAVGQLYEYRYFKVSDPNSGLVFLADRPVPLAWVRYLERDRHIGAMWPVADGFELTNLAARALRLSVASKSA